MSSANAATGSALCCSPCSPATAYLYTAPWPTAGTNPSQIPEPSLGASGLRPLSQPFQSPTTDTARALGAQTAKYVPGLRPDFVVWAPSLRARR